MAEILDEPYEARTTEESYSEDRRALESISSLKIACSPDISATNSSTTSLSLILTEQTVETDSKTIKQGENGDGINYVASEGIFL
jgi:hypothetical protein